ncbi:phage protein GemA/Gp16 family protein [Sulfurimonas sp.]|uniref:phage protein GemA/Gp16 family protein n=1 Tax=Sulfurimonas sp. TaxID=2022749 RepID=UPI002B496209|nr:phage protein GemA/Gp16 family protein [Sulfurimonas sp.]
MTEKQRNYQSALIKSIHSSELYKDVYSDDRELYEAMLENTFGVLSSKKLSIEELINLNNFMNKKGELRVAPKKVGSTTNQINFIKTLWSKNSRNKDLNSLLTQVKKVIKRDINALESLTKDEAGKVIASIKNIKPEPKLKLNPSNNTNYKSS